VERLNERLAEARAALATLQDLVEKQWRSAVERDAAIMRFAYTFEAVWKAAQRYLIDREGLDVGREGARHASSSPRLDPGRLAGRDEPFSGRRAANGRPVDDRPQRRYSLRLAIGS
jgi:hypothetical protein